MIRDTYLPGDAKVPAKGVEVRNLRQGTVLDTEGRRKLIFWLEMDATSPVDISIEGAKPINPINP